MGTSGGRETGEEKPSPGLLSLAEVPAGTDLLGKSSSPPPVCDSGKGPACPACRLLCLEAVPESALLSCPWCPESSKVPATRRRAAEGNTGIGNVAEIPRQVQSDSEGRLQPTFRGQVNREKLWSQASLREHRPLAPASDFRSSHWQHARGAEAGQPDLRTAARAWPQMPQGASKAPHIPSCYPKGGGEFRSEHLLKGGVFPNKPFQSALLDGIISYLNRLKLGLKGYCLNPQLRVGL